MLSPHTGDTPSLRLPGRRRTFQARLPVYLGPCDFQVAPKSARKLGGCKRILQLQEGVCTRSTSPSASHATVPLPVVAATREFLGTPKTNQSLRLSQRAACVIFFFLVGNPDIPTHLLLLPGLRFPLAPCVPSDSVFFCDSRTEQTGECRTPISKY